MKLPRMTQLPEFADIRGHARVVSLPMRTRFRGVDRREALLLEGPQGWAEFSPFAEYDDQEASTWLAAAIDYGWHVQSRARRQVVGVNATVPAIAATAVPALLARFGTARTVKVKVAEAGQLLADDIARVRAVRDALGPEGRIRVDANGGWNVDEAEHAIHQLAEYDLEYVEQPCATVAELVQIRNRTKYLGIPVAADESIRKVTDPRAVANAEAADVIVLKAQPLGGVARALEIADAVGLPAVVSSALDTAVGIGQGLALAAALPTLEFDCGLATSYLFERDVAEIPRSGGEMTLTRVRPDDNTLKDLAADPSRTQWWLDRLRRCYEVLARIDHDE